MGNLLNWTIGGAFMRSMGVMAKVPNRVLLPIVLLVTITAIYVQETSLVAIWIAFGILGYVFRRLDISVLPFVIAFILAGPLEETARQAFSASGGDPWFLFRSPIALAFMALAFASVAFLARAPAAGVRRIAAARDRAARSPAGALEHPGELVHREPDGAVAHRRRLARQVREAAAPAAARDSAAAPATASRRVGPGAGACGAPRGVAAS